MQVVESEVPPVISLSMEVWAADISTVIDEIERMSDSHQAGGLGAIVDLSKIAAAGMSFGGATNMSLRTD